MLRYQRQRSSSAIREYKVDGEVFSSKRGLSQDRWGADQAETYIIGLFDAFAKIESHEVLSRPIPAELGVDGFFFRYKKHFVYWRYLSNGDIGIVTILHQCMHQIERLKDDFGLDCT